MDLEAGAVVAPPDGVMVSAGTKRGKYPTITWFMSTVYWYLRNGEPMASTKRWTLKQLPPLLHRRTASWWAPERNAANIQLSRDLCPLYTGTWEMRSPWLARNDGPWSRCRCCTARRRHGKRRNETRQISPPQQGRERFCPQPCSALDRHRLRLSVVLLN